MHGPVSVVAENGHIQSPTVVDNECNLAKGGLTIQELSGKDPLDIDQIHSEFPPIEPIEESIRKVGN